MLACGRTDRSSQEQALEIWILVEVAAQRSEDHAIVAAPTDRPHPALAIEHAVILAFDELGQHEMPIEITPAIADVEALAALHFLVHPVIEHRDLLCSGT